MFRSRLFGAAVLPRVAGAFLVAVIAGAVAHAQSTSGATDAPTVASAAPSAPVFNMQAELKAPLNLEVADSTLGESSSSVTALEPVALGADPAAADGGGQPPPYRRRRYGRPNYNDRYHNKDGSNRLAFVAGAGFTIPSGSTGKQFNLNYSLKGGGGINLSKKFGVLAEFNYDRFGLQGSALTSQYNLYSSLKLTDSTGALVDFSGLDAHAYVWSITLNPIFNFYQTEKTGAYVVVGGGFYHKVVNFTLPQIGQYCDPYYGCYQFQQNQTFDHYADNAGGVNGGIGFTYTLSRFSNQKLFAEARYVEVFNSKSGNSSNSLYPPATARTGYFPVTVGVRF